MRVVVCIPWRTNPEREPIFQYVRNLFSQFGEVIVGDTDDEVFTVAKASNAAVRAAGDWEVMVYTGADCLVAEPRQVWEAIELAADGAFVAAHSEIRRLTAEPTADILATGRLPSPKDAVEYAYGNTWEGTRVIGRDLWDQFGGFDERLTSGEGLAFSWSCGTLAGKKQMRVNGLHYHLWHEYRWTSPEQIAEVRKTNNPLLVRYKEAAGNPVAIRAMLAESAQARLS